MQDKSKEKHKLRVIDEYEVYEELAQLAKEANILVILELLTAHQHSGNDVPARDRLSQAITHILVYRRWRKALGIEDMCFDLLHSMNDSNLVHRFFTFIESLPLTFAKKPHYWGYFRLGGQKLVDLIADLLKQPTFRNNIGVYGCFMANRYLEVCTDLLEICQENRQVLLAGPSRGMSRSPIWRSFLLSPPQLGDIPANYLMIQNCTQCLNLPLIPFFEIEDRHWLLSTQQLTDTLLCAYMELKKYAKENASFGHHQHTYHPLTLTLFMSRRHKTNLLRLSSGHVRVVH